MARPVTQGGTPISRVQRLRYLRPLIGLLSFWLGLVPVKASGGAWVPPPQTGIVIANLVEVESDQGRPGASFEIYAEYGFKPGWAAILTPSWSQSVQTQSTNWMADEVLVGLRRKLWVRESLAISSQISAFSIPSANNETARTYGIESRLAVGKSFGDKAWVNVEAASRTCGQTGVGSRFDATFGYKLEEGQRLIVKAFGDGNGCIKPIVRAQISYVRPVSDTLSVEIGWREALSESSELADRGFVIGLWQKF